MRTVSSYGAEIRKPNIPLRLTMKTYRQAVSYLTEIYVQVWEELREIPETKKRFNAAEHMVHTTKKNTARFDFDLCFPKMPSYLRRAAIQHALGSISSYETRLEQWTETGKLTGKPRLSCENHAMPVFYRDVMYREGGEGKDEAYLKLYDGHDWKWFRVCLKHTDMEYLRRNWKGKKASAPTLEKRQRRYFLRFFYTEEVTLTKTPVEEQIIPFPSLLMNSFFLFFPILSLILLILLYLLHHEEIESLAKNIPGVKRIRFFMTFGQSYLTASKMKFSCLHRTVRTLDLKVIQEPCLQKTP